MFKCHLCTLYRSNLSIHYQINIKNCTAVTADTIYVIKNILKYMIHVLNQYNYVNDHNMISSKWVSEWVREGTRK